MIEPFTGSASIFNNTNYPNYLLGEDNRDLVALFQHLQLEQEAFIDYCKTLFCESNNCALRYYELRKLFNQSQQPRERAALFLYLNRHGYNGLCRYNNQGIYNVPFGRYIKPYFPEAEMRYFYQKSHQATFIHSDFRQTFMLARPGDLIYCDPPYAPIMQSSNFSAYTHRKFGEKEQIILAELAREQATRGVTVIISNHDTPFTRKQYFDAEIKSFLVKRSISCHSEKRLKVTELVAIFNATSVYP